jgi:hypothetical protein
MSRSSPSRRSFLKASAVAGAAIGAPGFLRARGANEKLNIAIIGSGGRGAANMNGVSSENIVAVCDVNANAVEAAAKKHPKAAKFADFRQLFDKAANTFDAVVVSTCEHTHAFATLAALKLGKHVYCEKPLTHNIAEARIIREAAAKTKLATQMGTQIHAEDNYRRVVELVQTGAIGPVREVHVWVGRAWGLQSAEDAKANKDIVLRHGTTERRCETAKRTELGLVVRAVRGSNVQPGLCAGAKMVSLVGLRERHHVRPRVALERSAVLGTQTSSANLD